MRFKMVHPKEHKNIEVVNSVLLNTQPIPLSLSLHYAAIFIWKWLYTRLG